nr:MULTISPECIES: preprotein translocase subunit YajC [unclassified Schaalia]
MLGVLLIFMLFFSSRSRKKMLAQQAERDRKLREDLVPGMWVKTAFGFWGRFVDFDGDVVVLETADGTETYWDRAVVREIGNPPFASVQEVEETEEPETQEEDEQVLGLDNDSSTGIEK